MDRQERTRRILEASQKTLTARGAAVTTSRFAMLSIPAIIGLPRLAVPVVRLPEVPGLASTLAIANSPLLRATQGLAKTFALYGRISQPMLRLGEFIARSRREQQRLEVAGFLPHYTTPFDLLEDLENPEAIAASLEAHYVENWPEVRATFESHVEPYAIDDEAKLVFREALTVHEAGAYRAVSRLLFAEIERLTRAELHQGALKGFTSQPRLKEIASRLCPAELNPSGLRALELFQRLDDHLYAKVDTPEGVERARRDPVPNRHAALHGLVAYDTRINSLNALIMTDFVFQVLSAHRQSLSPPAAA